MTIQNQIENALKKQLSLDILEIKNQSHLHAGHSGDDGSGESHFKIKISSKDFDGKTRLERNRMIYNALGDIMDKIHALSIQNIENH